MESTVQRVCGAVVRDGRILMVRHREPDGDPALGGGTGRDFWTLPGGGVEAGETPAEAAVREVAEEARIAGTAGAVLYERSYVATSGQDVHETCFLVEVPVWSEPALGHDPELAADAQVLVEVGWFPLDDVRDDRQVALALPALRRLAIAPS